MIEMERTKAKRFWQEVWDRYVDKQKYDNNEMIKKGMEDKSDSFMVSTAIWEMSDKEFDKILNLASKKTKR